MILSKCGPAWLLSVLAGLLVLLPMHSALATNLKVDDDGAQCPNPDFATIQAAVNAAALTAGADVIRICAGTYPENVTIGPGNSVKLEGDGMTNTFVTGVAATAGPIIDVNTAGKVDIKKLTVDGGSAQAGGTVWGIRYKETDGKIDNIAVLNIRNASGSSQGVGIRVESTGASTKVDVKNSLLDNFTRAGVNGNGMGVDLKVENNLVIGPDAPKVWAPNGIQLSRGAMGTAKNNEVHDMTSPVPSAGAGSGIILFCAGPADVSNNDVFTSDLGIAIADNQMGTVKDNVIHDSVFDSISLQFIGTLFGPLGCPLFPSPTEDNEVKNNRALNSGDTGISFANFDPGTDPSQPADNTIENCKVKDSVNDGIHVFDGMGNLFKRNDIDNSGGTDAVDDTSGGGTAGTANTWDHNKCSTSSPSGLCQ